MPDYLVTDPATGQRIKMTGPAPPSEALIRLALAKVKPLPSHVQQTPDPLQALQKAQTIGPARVGERYLDDLNPSLVGIARKVLGGAQRPPSVAAEDPYGIGAWLKGAGPMPTPIAAEIQAYHGSPHDFEKFLLEKIGTGEGAQSYGHGLYFAENPGVAEEYRRQLTTHGKYNLYVNGKQMSFRDASVQAFGDKVGGDLATYFESGDASRRTDMQKPETLFGLKAKLTEQGHDVELRPLGGTYHVSIKADPDQFLDWDKPLSQQSEQVQKAVGLSKELSDRYQAIQDRLYTLQHEKNGLDSPEWKSLVAEAGSIRRSPIHPAMTGQQALDTFGAMTGMIGTDAREGASALLREKGIPGIKYLDQGSRNSSMLAVEQGTNLRGGPRFTVNGPQGDMHFDTMKEAHDYIAKHQSKATSNYVVFDDKLIDILKKYAVAGAVGGSLASLGQQPAEEQK